MTAILISFVILGVIFITLSIFFDQAILNRAETIYKFPTKDKKIALTFDDGPSLKWTPLILDILKKENVKATFFMIGHHVQKYPQVARRVAEEGHTIGNHGYAHSVILYYTPAEIEEEIKYTEHVIREITGKTTRLYRPPKSWIKKDIKHKIKNLGYDIILWSLNSKDWVGFPSQSLVNFISKRVKAGDIILFHDSGNIVGTEGGDRTQTVKAVQALIQTLKSRDFVFVPLEELEGVHANA
jgi:peptidoglycan/xylan/chitin deacetylase (PgdA/CDA1 family)